MSTKTNYSFARQLLMVIVGSMIMGIGVHLTIMSNLGGDPLTVFWIGLNRNLLANLEISQISFGVNVVLAIIGFFIDRKQISLATILNPIVMSLTMASCARFFMQIFDQAVIQYPVMIIGLLLVALGIAIYSLAQLGTSPFESLVFGLNNKTKLSIRVLRTSMDLCFLIMAILLGVRTLQGPVVAFLFSGIFIQFFFEKLQTSITNFIQA